MGMNTAARASMEPMQLPASSPGRDQPVQPDWEAFYRGYRKPGYVSGFEILHKLGGGTFGVVFKARKESIGKLYAIKFLRVEDAGVREQVLRELDHVALFAQVDHPNLVTIEDKGVVDGIPYIVMGYAGDETLRTRLDEGRLAEDEALRLFVQVARGVQALHEHSLVHFDLKPANVFLKGDVVRVGDYGLSKLITGTQMSLTTGRGTPYYMAPEMLRRKGDHRSDIYSLGVLLFECLAGRVPFGGENEWEVLKAHEERQVDFPDDVPPRYRPILVRMLAKDPAQRFATIAEVLAALGGTPMAVAGASRRHVVPVPAPVPAVAAREPEPAIADRPLETGNWWPWVLVAVIVALATRDRSWSGGELLAMGVALYFASKSWRRSRSRRPTASQGRGHLFLAVLVALCVATCGTWYVGRGGPAPEAAATRATSSEAPSMPEVGVPAPRNRR
jgi:tRNA A-37 threonylcarbamoyl transferase component Bud32